MFKAMTALAGGAAAMLVAGAADAATFLFDFTAPIVQFGSAGDSYVGQGSIVADDNGDGTFSITGASGSVSIQGYPQYVYGIDAGQGVLARAGDGSIGATGLLLSGSSGPGFYAFTANGDGSYRIDIGEVGAPAGTLTIGAAIAAVPEPASWGMMILGFGLTGGAMRRRRPIGTALA